MFGSITNKDDAKEEISSRLNGMIQQLGGYGLGNAQRLVELTGRSKQYISDLLNGKKMPSLETVFLISRALNRDFKELLSGLEDHIKPKGYSIVDFTFDEQVRYYIAIQNEWSRFLSEQEELNAGITYPNSISLIKIKEMKLYDKSMEGVGLVKGSSIRYTPLNEEVKNGRVYIVRHNDKLIARRVWLVDDEVILIPCDNDLTYDIIQANKNEVVFEGVPTGISYSLNLCPPPEDA